MPVNSMFFLLINPLVEQGFLVEKLSEEALSIQLVRQLATEVPDVIELWQGEARF